MRKFPLLLLILTAFFAACSDDPDQSDEAGHNHENHQDHSGHDHSMHEDMAAGEATDMSVYNLTSNWTTQEEKEIQLGDLQGEIQVVAMVYSTCQFACPRIVADMKRIQQAVQKEGLQDEVNYVLVSIDPEVDTPEQWRKFAQENKMDPEHWTLLNSDNSNVLELAALLGVRYKKTSEKDYSHSNIITVLNKEGEIAYQQEGLGQNPTGAINTIKELAEE